MFEALKEIGPAGWYTIAAILVVARVVWWWVRD